MGFASDANGNVPPVVKIRGNHTPMGKWGGLDTGVGVDSSGRLYIAGESPCEIGVWPAGRPIPRDPPGLSEDGGAGPPGQGGWPQASKVRP